MPLRRPVALLFASLALTVPAFARPVEERQAAQQWVLQAGDMTYVVGVDEQKMLETLYWGPKLAAGATLPAAHSRPERASFDPPIGTTPLEYPAWGAGLYTEPALKVDSPNGDRTLVLVFDSAATPAPNQLEITLKDTVQPIRVHLFYQIYPEGILARWSRIENVGKAPFVIEQAASATWNLPHGTGYELSTLTGQWGGEWQLHTAPLQPGAQVLESRRGSTSHQANPWFAIGRTAETTETAGPVWFGELGWSGSWRMTVENTALHNVRVTAGYNPFDFALTLKPGESRETPRFYAGYTGHGQGEASRSHAPLPACRPVLPGAHPNPERCGRCSTTPGRRPNSTSSEARPDRAGGDARRSSAWNASSSTTAGSVSGSKSITPGSATGM